MNVILTLILFPHDQPVCEIDESDFNIGFVSQVTNLFLKYMKVISTLVLFSMATCLGEKYKEFQVGLILMSDLLTVVEMTIIGYDLKCPNCMVESETS
jgi:hypothetical protein